MKNDVSINTRNRNIFSDCIICIPFRDHAIGGTGYSTKYVNTSTRGISIGIRSGILDKIAEMNKMTSTLSRFLK